MSYYETLFIVHPALEDGRLKDIILSLEESLKKLGGNILSINLWGKKRLAYIIDKQKYGAYVQLQFTGEGDCISSFEMELDHNPNILSYLSILIEKSDVIEQDNDLDTQIAGQSREVQRINKSSENVSSKDAPKEDKAAKNDDTSEKSEVEEKDESEKNTDNIEESPENLDGITPVSEEE